MKKTKWISLVLATALCIGFTGCIGNFYENAGTVDGREISAGLYLNLQYNAFSEGKSLLEDSEADPFRQEIDGVKFKDWVDNRTEELMRKFVCVERMCAEREIILSEENRGYLEQVATYWDMSKEVFEENGISYDTLMLTMTNDMLSDELFKYMYAEDGELAPPDEEIRAAYDEGFGQIEYLMLPYNTTGDNAENKSDEVTVVAEEMKARLEKGETIEDVAGDGVKAAYEIVGREYTDESLSSSISTSYIEFTGGEDDEYYPPEFRAQLKEMDESTYGIHQMGSLILVYHRIPNFASDSDFADARADAVSSLYQEDFDQYLAEIYNAYPITFEPGARAYLSPKKIVSP